MRLRETGGLLLGPVPYQITYAQPVKVPYNGSYQDVFPSDYASMLDVVTPHFTKTRNSGGIINNDMSQVKYSLKSAVTPYTYRERTWTYPQNVLQLDNTTSSGSVNGLQRAKVYLQYPFSGVVKDPFPASLTDTCDGAEDALTTKVFAKAAATDVVGLVSLAELNKTLDSALEASKAFTRLNHWLNSIPRKWFKHVSLTDFTPMGFSRLAGKTAKALGPLWLEYRYGIMPTVYEINAYIERHKTLGRSARVRFTTHQEGSVSKSKTVHRPTQLFYNDVDMMTAHRTDRVSAGCLIEPYAENFDEVHTLGLDRIGYSAWELVPFSFVADWFFNVGDLIAAHEGRYGQRVLAAWTKRVTSIGTTFEFQRNYRDYVVTGSNPLIRRKGSGLADCSASEHVTRVVRKPVLSPPVLPSFKVNLDYKKMLDLGALAHGFTNNLKTRLRY